MRRVRRSLSAVACVAVLMGLSLAAPPPAQAAFAVEDFKAALTAEGGQPATQAGSHPLALEVGLDLKTVGGIADGDLRNLEIELPSGLIENPTVVDTCSQAAFSMPRSSPWEESLAGESCPDRTQVGVIAVHSSYGGGQTRTFGLFNLSPPPGAPSELAANVYGSPIIFVPKIRQTQGDYGITLRAANLPQLINISSLHLTLWGTPWSVLHDEQRGNCLNEREPGFGWAKCSVGRPAKNPHRAYLTLPTSCEVPLAFTLTAEAWQASAPAHATLSTAPLEDCDSLQFAPEAHAALINPRASSPSGYQFRIDVDNAGVTNPALRAPSAVRKAVIELPDGVTINPSVGAGLGVCTPARFEAETPTSPPGAGCPEPSTIGDFSVHTPLYAGPLDGAIYLAQPYQNPAGSLIGIYLVAKAPQRGFLVKVFGQLDPDPQSGRLTATFDRLPQLPYSQLEIDFREGQRSPLATPPACGTVATEADLTPWRDPALVRHASLPSQIASGVGGGPCPSGIPPFAPAVAGGSLNSQAGAYSPFYLHLTRTDTEQEITSYSATFPPGLLGKLVGVPYCPRRRDRSGGRPQRPAGAAKLPPARRRAGSGRPTPAMASARSSPTRPATSTSPAPTTAPRSRWSRSTPPSSAPSTSA